MKTLLKLAMGAAVASALVHYLTKQRSSASRSSGEALRDDVADGVPRTGGFTIEELSGESREWGGGSSGLNS